MITELHAFGTPGWTSGGTQNVQRFDQTATPLANGSVLVTGGKFSGPCPPPFSSCEQEASAELWDAASATWSLTTPLATGRTRHVAAAIAGGAKVLVAGGHELASAE